MSYFKNQSLLTLRAETKYVDLATANEKKILFKKPNGEPGEWSATHEGTELVYDVAVDDIDQEGIWSFQAYIKVGDKEAFGEVVRHKIYKPLND